LKDFDFKQKIGFIFETSLGKPPILRASAAYAVLSFVEFAPPRAEAVASFPVSLAEKKEIPFDSYSNLSAVTLFSLSSDIIFKL